MIIAISSPDGTLESPVDQRFGRASKFIVFNTETNTFTVIDNTQNLEAAQGAGIQSAQNVVNAGSQVLITGHTGPKAFRVLQSANVETFLASNMSAADAVQAWKNGTLAKSDEADVESHWI